MNRYFEMQRKLAPVIGVIAIVAGAIFLGSILWRGSQKEESRMSDTTKIVVGSVFVAVGLAFVTFRPKKDD